MITKIITSGDSQGIILDETIMNLAQLKLGDQMNLEIHANGTLTLTPLHSQPSHGEVSDVIQKTMEDYSSTMKKLA